MNCNEYEAKVKEVQEAIESANSITALEDNLNTLLKPERQWISLEGMYISERDRTLRGNFYMDKRDWMSDWEKTPYYYILKESFFSISYGNWHKHYRLGGCIQYYGSLPLSLAKGLSKTLDSLQEKRNNLADKLQQAKLEYIKQFSLDNEVSFKELKLLKDRVAFIEAYLQAQLDTERGKLDNLYQQETKAIEVPNAFKRSITFDKPCILFTDLELK